MNTRNTESEFTEKDLTEFLKKIENDNLDEIFNNLFEMHHRLFLLGIYFKVSSYVL